MSDYIKREDAIKIINSGISIDTYADKRYVNGLFRAIRPADVAPVRHGRAIYKDDGNWYCETCGRQIPDLHEYCNHCGVKIGY